MSECIFYLISRRPLLAVMHSEEKLGQADPGQPRNGTPGNGLFPSCPASCSPSARLKEPLIKTITLPISLQHILTRVCVLVMHVK
jgi:hypothetical protein